MSSSSIQIHVDEASPMPAFIESRTSGAKMTEWIAMNKAIVNEYLCKHKALVFRGFEIDETHFSTVVSLLCNEPLDYLYQSTPRTRITDKVYTATEYPAHYKIPFHNENAYQLDWPMRLIFYCARPAVQGGETPIADTVKVTKRIDPKIVETFSRKRIKYVRNYGSGLDLAWTTVFQTDKKSDVEKYCLENKIEFEWRQNECLRTSQVCQAVAEHPETGQQIWFNQAHLFHVSSLDERTQRGLLKIYKEDELPRNAFFGDGAPLDPEHLAHIRRAYLAESVVFPWQSKDVMVLDNMLVSHARNPFEGQRRVLAGMGDVYSKQMHLQRTN